MKKISKKYIFVLLLILIVGGYFGYKNFDKFFGKNNESQDVTFGTLEAIVEKKTFDSEIELTGITKIKNEQKIKFNTSGKITEVNFKVGDNVKKGDKLVAIESTKAQSEINKAIIELDKSKRNLSKIVDDLKDHKLKAAILDLELAKTSIENKENDLSILKKKQENDLKSKQNEIETAKNNFVIEEARLKKELAVSKLDNANLTGGNSLKEKNLAYEKQKREYEDFKLNFQAKLNKKLNEYKLKLENTYYDLEKDVREFEYSLRDLEEIIGVRTGNFEYGIYFSARNSLNMGKIKEYYYKAGEDFKIFKAEFKKVSGKNDSKNILKALEAGKNFYENAYFMYTYVQEGFDNSVETEGFSPGAYASKFSPFLSKSSSMRSSITNLIDELKEFESEEKIKKDLQDELEKQRIAIETAEIDIKKFLDEKDFSTNTFDASQKNNLIALEELKINLNQKILEFQKFERTQKDEYRQAEINIEKDKISLKQQEEEFEKLKNLSKNDEFLSAEEGVKQSELNLENAVKQLENYIITAPFDGVITKMDYKIGDRITENSDLSVYIVDPKTIEIDIFINQSDIVKVRKDMEASILLDSYPENILKGKLSEIDTTPSMDNETGLSKFSAKVLIGDYGDLKLYTGMQANVKLKVSSIPESLVVPFSAVNTDDDGTKYVTVIESGKKIKRTVEVGEPVGEYYQILSGLKEGEIVLEIDYDASKIKDENPDAGMGMQAI